VLCNAKLKKTFDTFAAHFFFLFKMRDSIDNGTWGQACQLWFWANGGGFIVLLVYLTLYAELTNNTSPSLFLFNVSIASVTSMTTAISSLLVVPLVHAVFRKLLRIAHYWLRLLATVAVVTGLFLLVVFAAGKSVLDDVDFSLSGVLLLGGWAYWVAALGATALVYRQHLFRPDAAAKLLPTEAEGPTA
jgi:hypothetical protein